MSEHFTYLLVDVCCIIFPLVCSFIPRFHFFAQWKDFIMPCLLTATFFSVWDILFTRWGVWSFNSRYVLGIDLFGLPLEEYLFFICIPYACTFTYYCLTRYFTISVSRGVALFTWLLALALAAVAVLNLPRLYTSVTFLLLAGVLVYLQARRASFLAAFYVAFLLIQLPFFLSNGILTGGIIGRMVVCYNGDHNLGIRMFTIPVEDTFYGMLLLLLNIALFERNRSRRAVLPGGGH